MAIMVCSLISGFFYVRLNSPLIFQRPFLSCPKMDIVILNFSNDRHSSMFLGGVSNAAFEAMFIVGILSTSLTPIITDCMNRKGPVVWYWDTRVLQLVGSTSSRWSSCAGLFDSVNSVDPVSGSVNLLNRYSWSFGSYWSSGGSSVRSFNW